MIPQVHQLLCWLVLWVVLIIIIVLFVLLMSFDLFHFEMFFALIVIVTPILVLCIDVIWWSATPLSHETNWIVLLGIPCAFFRRLSFLEKKCITCMRFIFDLSAKSWRKCIAQSRCAHESVGDLTWGSSGCSEGWRLKLPCGVWQITLGSLALFECLYLIGIFCCARDLPPRR